MEAQKFADHINNTDASFLAQAGELAKTWNATRSILRPDEAHRCADPSEIWSFQDGSSAIIDNPNGVAFDIAVTVCQ